MGDRIEAARLSVRQSDLPTWRSIVERNLCDYCLPDAEIALDHIQADCDECTVRLWLLVRTLSSEPIVRFSNVAWRDATWN